MSHISTVICHKMWKAPLFASIRGNHAMKRQTIAAGSVSVCGVGLFSCDCLVVVAVVVVAFCVHVVSQQRLSKLVIAM